MSTQAMNRTEINTTLSILAHDDHIREVEVQGVLSHLVIPAVPGEYYSYTSEFTVDRPLYALLKCKANKDRPISAMEELGREANLFFSFGNPVSVRPLGGTWITPTGITPADFDDLRSRRDVTALVEASRIARSGHMRTITLERGMVVAMMTDSGKYGLFLIKGITSTSIQIEACHILL